MPMHTMEYKILRTFCVALFGLPLFCESRRYCYTTNYEGYTYKCEYRRSIPEVLGISYGVVTGVGLLVSLFVFILCKSKQSRSNNSRATHQTLTNVGYIPAEQLLVVPGQSGIMQTTPPHGTVITNSGQPTHTQGTVITNAGQTIPPQGTMMINSGLLTGKHPLQTQMHGQAQAGRVTCGVGGRTQMSQPAAQLEQMKKQDHPPPYSRPI